jgi:hypothetical protein
MAVDVRGGNGGLESMEPMVSNSDISSEQQDQNPDDDSRVDNNRQDQSVGLTSKKRKVHATEVSNAQLVIEDGLRLVANGLEKIAQASQTLDNAGEVNEGHQKGHFSSMCDKLEEYLLHARRIQRNTGGR